MKSERHAEALARATATLAPVAAAVVPAALVALLSGARRVWITPHERPDGDALGAALALQAILEQRGAEVAVISADSPAAVYDVIPTIGRVVRTAPAWEPDAAILVDCADPARAGSAGALMAALPATTPRAILDHHVSNHSDAPTAWIDPTAAATCEMVTLLGIALGADLAADNGAIASALGAGLIMDTATFQHGNTTPRTLQVAALLLAAGAPISEISRRLYRSRPLSQLQLHARVLGRVERSDAGRTVWAALSLADLSATGSTAEESEGIVDALAQVVEADVALFLKEDGPTATRLSIRTKELGPDATKIAAAFGGGGHARAAGATIALPLAEASGAALKAVAELRAGASAS